MISLWIMFNVTKSSEVCPWSGLSESLQKVNLELEVSHRFDDL